MGGLSVEKEAGRQLGGCRPAFSWWSMRDLNPRPTACKAVALPLRQSTKTGSRIAVRGERGFSLSHNRS